jgi:drug/metabolite transporter (DMT)-like permease
LLNSKLGQYAILGILGLVWGSSFILMRFGLEGFNSWQVGSMRLVFAGLIAVPVLLMNYKKIQRKDWLFLALAGIVGNGFPAYMFTYAQKNGLDSSIAGALNALTPAFTLIFGLMLFKIHVKPKQIWGLAVGLIGALALIMSKIEPDLADFSLWPFFVVILACMFYGININIIKSKIGHISPILAGMVPLAIVSFPATGILFYTETPEIISGPVENWGIPLVSVFILGLAGTAFSLILFNALVQKTNALFGSSVNFLLPFVAAFWGLVFGEAFGFYQFIFMLMILTGIYLIR